MAIEGTGSMSTGASIDSTVTGSSAELDSMRRRSRAARNAVLSTTRSTLGSRERLDAMSSSDAMSG